MGGLIIQGEKRNFKTGYRRKVSSKFPIYLNILWHFLWVIIMETSTLVTRSLWCSGVFPVPLPSVQGIGNDMHGGCLEGGIYAGCFEQQHL